MLMQVLYKKAMLSSERPDTHVSAPFIIASSPSPVDNDKVDLKQASEASSGKRPSSILKKRPRLYDPLELLVTQSKRVKFQSGNRNVIKIQSKVDSLSSEL
jgi:hypothetical protein